MPFIYIYYIVVKGSGSFIYYYIKTVLEYLAFALNSELEYVLTLQPINIPNSYKHLSVIQVSNGGSGVDCSIPS